jgi:transitional endoplasmic reticulum ATPase
LTRFFDKAEEACRKDEKCVVMLFIDECDALLSSEVVAGTLSSLLDRTQGPDSLQRILIVAATNTIDSIPSYLRRPGRFDKEVSVAPPTSEERLSMLRSLSDDANSLFALESKTLQMLAEECVGYVPADLVALVRRAVALALGSGKQVVDEELFRNAMMDVGASALRDSSMITPPETKWSDIAGQVAAKKTLRQAIEWPLKKREKFKSLGLQPPKGILMYG